MPASTARTWGGVIWILMRLLIKKTLLGILGDPSKFVHRCNRYIIMSIRRILRSLPHAGADNWGLLTPKITS